MFRRRVKSSALIVVFTLALVALGGAAVSAIQTDFVDEVVFSGLDQPSNVEFAADGRVFVAEKTGRVKVFDSLTDPTPDTFADLSANVHNFWDRGLLGLAVHPDFPTTPYVYVLYTYDAPIGGTPPTWGDACPSNPGATDDGCVVSGRLSRLEAAGNSMSGPEVVLVEDWCQQYPSHSIGDIEFGSDGALYVTGGDGASFTFEDYGQGGGDVGSPTPENPCGDPPVPVGGNQTPPSAEGGALRSQDLLSSGDPVSLDGTVLRLDPITGEAMSDNPLIGHSDPNARRIVAYGLRNPFRMAIKPGTNDIYTGDVGWNTWEEVNAHTEPASAVLNYGWPCYEGGDGSSLRQPGYDSEDLTMCEDLYLSGTVTAPLMAYRHDEDIAESDLCPPANPPQGTSSSISGLDFYTGGGYPGTYTGALFGSDYSRDCIWVMFPDEEGDPDPTTVEVFQHEAENPVDIERGTNGDIFYVNLNGGEVRRLRFVGTNTPPDAVISAEPTSGTIPFTVDFDASGSSDADQDALSFAWDFDDDGSYDDGVGEEVQWSYDEPGSHMARLRVTDARGETDTDSVVINASNAPPVPVIDTPSSSLHWIVGQTVNFSGHADDPDEGELADSALDWRLLLHHCEDDGTCHVHGIVDYDGVSGGSFDGPDHEYPSWLELELTATDQYGSSVTTSITLDPQTVEITFETFPAGLELIFGGVNETSPFVEEVIVGSLNGVSATTPQQTPDLHEWEFVLWSDGGARTHDIVAPSVDTTYTVTFNRYPTITGPTDTDVSENTTPVADLSGIDDLDSESAGFTYAISGGADGNLFDVTPGTGVVSFSTPPDFEAPADSDSDGIYEVEVTLTDSGGLGDTLAIIVSVQDANDPPVAADDAYETDEDVELVVDGVLGNDSDVDSPTLTASTVTGPANGNLTLNANGSFTYTPNANYNGTDQFTYEACDAAPLCDTATVTITVNAEDPGDPGDPFDGGDSVGVVDATTGLWYLRTPGTGAFTSFYYGNPQDYPIMGDWNCDGIDTPGLYRQSDGHVYLRNSNTQGIAHIRFFFGNHGDIPIAGDFDGNGCDTVSIYRPSEGRAYIINKLGQNNGGLGQADYAFYFGNPSDKPFVGDFNNDGTDTLGLHRETTGFIYLRNTNTAGTADLQFFFGNPADRILAGNWAESGTPGAQTIAVHRPSTGTIYLKFTNEAGNADHQYPLGNQNTHPIAGHFGDLPGGSSPPPGP